MLNQFKFRLTSSTRQKVECRLRLAFVTHNLRLVKRINVLLALAEGYSVAEVAQTYGLGKQTVRDYLHAFMRKGVESLVYKQPPGRRAKLTPSQRQELKKLIEEGPLEAGYECACWSALMVQDLIEKHFGICYHPHYVSTLLRNLGFSFQKARFISDHLNEEKRKEWMEKKWPEILRLEAHKQARILFGDEASFAQWGSLSYTWALKGQQPTIKTSGKRKAYKVFGLIDYRSGRFFYKSHTGRFNSESYKAFLQEVLRQSDGQHLIIIQDGARYHTSFAMKEFFQEQSERLTIFQLPSYSPDFNPIEFLWKKMKKRSTHLRHFPEFTDLIEKVDEGLLYFAKTPSEIISLMGKYCKSLGTEAA